MSEIWKDIPGYENLYQVSNFGNVKSYVPSNKHFGTKCHLLKPTPNDSGYLVVTLYANQTRRKFLIHRLVAEVFIPNPSDHPCINHKDENPANNHVDNLEWCTYAYNNAYGTAKIRSIQTKSRRVNQYTIDGIWIASYLSIGIAAKLLNVSATSIKDCCSGKEEFAHGYKWEYGQTFSQ